MTKTKNSIELEMLRIRIFPYNALVDRRAIAKIIGKTPELVSRVICGTRTDRHGILKIAEEMIKKELEKTAAQLAKKVTEK